MDEAVIEGARENGVGGVRTEVFAGAGAMRASCRALDWAATPLGAVETWPQSLRTAAATALGAGFPTVLLWGPKLVQLYNDAAVPIFAAKHPAALGQPTQDCWPELWDIAAPTYARVQAGETVTLEEAHFPVRRGGADGPVDDLYLSISYGPVPDEAGRVGGVLVTLLDTTAQVVGRAARAEQARLEARLHGALLDTAHVLEQVSDAYMLMDGDFRITAVNPSAERVLRRPRADLVGRTHWDAFPASVGAEPERQYLRVAAERVEAHFVHHYVGEGYDFHLEIDAYPVAHGGVAVFWRDVSERVRAEAALRAGEARHAFLLSLSDVLRGLHDSAAVQAAAARVLGERLGADRAYYVEVDEARSEFVVEREWHRSGAPSHARRYPLAGWPMSWLADGRPWAVADVDTDPALPDDQRAGYRGNDIGACIVVPLVKGGRLVATLAVNQRAPRAWTPEEIALVEAAAERTWAAVERARAEAALSASEARFRALATASADVLYRMSPDWGELRELDGRSFLSDTGEPSADWLGRYIHPDDQARVTAAVAAAVRTRSTFALEHRVIRADGTFGWTFSRAVPLLGADGEITEWIGAASDVTARRDADDALRASEARYRTLFDSIDEGFCVVEVLFEPDGEGGERPADYRFLEANPAFTKQTGLAGAVGRTMRELAPAHEAHWFETYGRVALTGEPTRFEAPAAALGRWYDVYAFRVGAPHARRVAILFADVTPRKRAEAERERLLAALEGERTLLRTVLDQMPAAVLIVEAPSGRVLALNDAVARVWGEPRPFTDGVGHYSEEWVGYHLDGRRIASEEWPIARAALFGETLTDWVGEIERPDGTRATIEVNAAPVRDAAGRTVAAVGVVADVTARVLAARERERLLHALEVERTRLAYVFQHAPAFLAVVRGPAYVFTLVNDAYYELVGRRELLGKPALEALPELRGQGFEELIDRVVETGTPFVGREVPVTVARGPDAVPEARFIDLTYIPLVEPDGTRSGVIAHGSDVTEQVEARREIERLLAESERARLDAEAARAEAEAANRSKGEFLAVMSHELRTPLNAIGGYAELIELGIRGPVTPQQREDLARIQKSQRHLLGLINGVLNYSRAEAGAVHYEMVDVLLDAVLAASETLIAPQARAKQLALHLAVCSEPLTVRADPEKLQQIVVNLLSNAVKFTAPGGVVTLACGRDSRSDAAGSAVVTVRDTGRGIAADALERVFEPFVQVDARLTRTQDGIGLGLAISRDLARGMGGDLVAESTLGVGSTFTLSLPAA